LGVFPILFQTGQKSLYGAMYGDLGRFSISFQVEVFELKGFNEIIYSEFFKECFDSIVWLRRLEQRSYDGRGLFRFIR
jgi:hypothetical protein